MKEIEIPFGAFDSELQGFEYTIPDGYTAEIVDGKVIIKKEESKDEKIRNEIIDYLKGFIPHHEDDLVAKSRIWIAWLEKQGKQNDVSIWKHWKDGIAGNGEGKLIYLVKSGNTFSLSSCLSFECDYIELSELDKLMAEKQCEQKSTDTPKFKVEKGNWYICTQTFSLRDKTVVLKSKIYKSNQNGVVEGENQCLFIDTHDGKAADYFRPWAIQDAKAGDVLAEGSCLFILKEMVNNSHSAITYCTLFNDGEFHDGETLYFDVSSTRPATKEQRDFLFQKMKEAGYEWDAERKELRKIEQELTELPNGEDYGIDSLYHAARILEKTLGEVDGYQSDDGILEHKCAIGAVNRLYKQKSTWIKEDERRLNSIIDALEGCVVRLSNFSNVVTEDIRAQLNDDITYFKSIKDQITLTNKNDFDRGYEVGMSAAKFNQWRPTEEQMNVLNDASIFASDPYNQVLKSLYEELKKL